MLFHACGDQRQRRRRWPWAGGGGGAVEERREEPEKGPTLWEDWEMNDCRHRDWGQSHVSSAAASCSRPSACDAHVLKLLLRIREPAVSFSAISRFCTTGDDLSQSWNGWFSPRVFFSVLNHSCRVSKEKRRDEMETASNVHWSLGAFSLLLLVVVLNKCCSLSSIPAPHVCTV